MSNPWTCTHCSLLQKTNQCGSIIMAQSQATYRGEQQEGYPQGPQDISAIDSKQTAHCGSGGCLSLLGGRPGGSFSITKEIRLRFLPLWGGGDADKSTTSSSTGLEVVRSMTGLSFPLSPWGPPKVIKPPNLKICKHTNTYSNAIPSWSQHKIAYRSAPPLSCGHWITPISPHLRAPIPCHRFAMR